MNKTLLRKLTEKTALKHAVPAPGLGMLNADDAILLQAAHHLLAPRPQAVANLLKMAKDI